MDPALLDRLRRGFPLRMDARGAFWFEGDPLDHPGIVAYFRRHLDADEAGDPIVSVDGKYVYLKCDDLPLRVTRVVARDDAPSLVLDDGRELPLDASSLAEERDAGLRCSVPAAESGRPLAARFGNTAAMDLERWIEWGDDDASGRPSIAVAGRRYEIPEQVPDA